MAKKKGRRRDPYTLDPSVHRTIVREVTDLVRSISHESFKIKYFEDEWLSKINDPESNVTSDARRDAAIEKWLLTEERNARTNQRLLLDSTTIGGLSTDVFFSTTRRFVSEIIGEEIHWFQTMPFGRFSGGASTSKSRLEGRAAQKFRDKADITTEAKTYSALYELGLVDALGRVDYRTVSGNILFTVPKNALIDRVACKEPDINMFLQLAAGGYIRKQLKKVGIDLNDQTRNQKLARIGSITGELATVDLSSASDSITTTLVQKCLPDEWFVLLDRIRSHKTTIGKDLHENQMFSSMGNGFTFELESLLFYCMCRAAAYHFGVKGTISVYGDDLIIPSQLYHNLKNLFGFAGLLFNSKKSYNSGPFRESCGSHWYNGMDVKPFYLREPIHHVSRLIHFLNRLRDWCSVDGICDPRFYPIWKKWSKLVPSQLKGGWDCERIDSLVSNNYPRLTLVRTSRNVTKKDFGAYLYWHNLKTVNPTAPPSEVEETLPVGSYVVRRYKGASSASGPSGWDVSRRPLFPQEL
ncbi:MAG: replicase [Cunavirus faecivicinum]|uniref:RNA-directed RNA polymerase n=1 Tax=Leviviridae sp. TaxID=2027243 RepID=A0ABY3SRW3_9VIRU|nr:MAG: replicase [Leviviridae sp.]